MDQQLFYKFKPLQLRNCTVFGQFPIPRSGHRIVVTNTHLYALGGYNPETAEIFLAEGRNGTFQELWAFNFATSRWTLLLNPNNGQNMPTELASHALVMYKNTMILQGGTSYPFGDVCTNHCYVIATDRKPYVKRLEVIGDRPVPLYGCAIVIHDHYLYTIGGTTGVSRFCDVFRLNLISKVWQKMRMSSLGEGDPEGRYRHELAYDGHYIYVFGGGSTNSVFDLRRIPAFNLQTNNWDYFETLPDLTLANGTSPAEQNYGYPLGRKAFSCVQHKMPNGDICAFIAGGMRNVRGEGNYYSDVWSLNLRTKQWNNFRTIVLPRPLFFHAAAMTENGCMYIYGGVQFDGTDEKRSSQILKVWVTIPKLSEICWEAITYYNKRLQNFDRLTLLQSGIPNKFVERLLGPDKKTQDELCKTNFGASPPKKRKLC